jgi:methionyl-tRNA formyltransferase
VSGVPRADRPQARTIFFGSGAFAVPILDALAGHDRIRLVAAVTAPDRPAGRRAALTPTPVAERAAELDLPLLQPERLRAPESVSALASLGPDLGVLADYGQIVPRSVLELPRFGILNIHPSLLPRHRGATPIQATIASGDERAGISILRMDEGLDTGPLVAQDWWALDGTERATELEAVAAQRGADLLERTLGPWLDGTIQPTPQEDSLATVTRPLRREDARLDPLLTALDLDRRVRANTPWPGSFVETELGRLAVLAASLAESRPGDRPGVILRQGDRPAIATSSGRLVLDRIRPAGGQAMDGADFVRGHPSIVGTAVLARR